MRHNNIRTLRVCIVTYNFNCCKFVLLAGYPVTESVSRLFLVTMTTTAVLLVAAASTIVLAASERFTSRSFAVDESIHPWFLARTVRDIPAASKSGSGAISFASSSSSSGSTASSGSSPGYNGYNARSGSLDGAPGYSGVNPGSVAFSTHDYDNYGYGQNIPYNAYGGAGYVPVDFNALFQQYVSFMQRLAQQQAYALNDVNSRAGFPGHLDFDGSAGFAYPGATNFGGTGGGVSDGGPVSASASANLSPRGGFGSVSISPPPQGNLELGARMGSVPSSGGPNYSVFTSSSSSSSDENGVKKSSKEATSVINDNGKVTTFHVRDP